MSTLKSVNLELIGPHPDNVRRDATPDAELVASVKAQGILQPLGVIETHTEDPRYQLIAGHRRLQAAKKAGLTDVPVIVLDHLDTRAKQIEAMLVENGRRTDLSPVEEADAYQQLALEGVSVAAIAKATGRTAKTVKARMALTSLPPKAAAALHAHQLTLAVADHLIQLAGYPQLLAEADELLEAGEPDEYDVRQLVAKIEVIEENRTLKATFEKSGLPVVDTMPDQGWYASKEWDRLYNETDPTKADAYYPGDDNGNWKSTPVLLKALKGGVETPEQANKRKAREKAEREKAKAASAAAELVELMRLEHVADMVTGIQIVNNDLWGHLRVATGQLINEFGPDRIIRITKAAGVDDTVIREKNDYSGEALAAAVNQLDQHKVLKLLLACLAQGAADGYVNGYYSRRDQRANENARAFWAAYTQSGYELPTADVQRRQSVLDAKFEKKDDVA